MFYQTKIHSIYSQQKHQTSLWDNMMFALAQ